MQQAFGIDAAQWIVCKTSQIERAALDSILNALHAVCNVYGIAVGCRFTVLHTTPDITLVTMFTSQNTKVTL